MNEPFNSKIGNGRKLPDALGLLLALFAQGKITARDLLILDCVNQGLSLRAIGRAIGIPASTVSRRLARVQHLCG